MMRRITATDIALALVFSALLATAGALAFRAAPRDQAAYGADLRALAATSAVLNRDIYRIQVNALNHFDTLVATTARLRRIEHRLGREPAWLDDSGDFGKLRLEVSMLVARKLALVEDFKTARAEFMAALDYLPELSERLSGSGAAEPFPRDLLEKLARFVQEPAPALGEVLAGEIEAAAAQDTTGPGAEGPAARHQHLVHRVQAIVEGKQRLNAVEHELASVPLLEAGAHLSAAYAEAARQHHRQSQRWTVALLVLLALVFGAISLEPRRRLQRVEAAAQREEAALKEALKTVRSQSAQLKRGEQEEAARLAEERLKALVRHSFEMVAILSREDNYIYVSPASEDLVGLTERELIGKSVYEGIHPDDLIKVQDYFTRAQKELQTDQTIQYRVMDAYGKWHVVETFASNQASNPAVRGMVLNTRRLGAADDYPYA